MARSTAIHKSAAHNKALELRKTPVVPIHRRIPRDMSEANLARFEDFDFKAFNKQDWDLYRAILSPDVVITYPDGRRAVGVEEDIKELKNMFAAIPDFRVTEHSVRIGSGDWTAVTGTVEGTFTGTMIAPDGTSIPPTGKSFKLGMCTVARWKDGRIVEEMLFWDGREYMRQLGLEK